MPKIGIVELNDKKSSGGSEMESNQAEPLDALLNQSKSVKQES